MKRRPFGVVMTCLWAVGLVIEVIARAWLLSIQQTSIGAWEFSLTLPTAVIAGLCILALCLALVGLWRLRNWGRKLFLTLITAYYGLLFIGSVAAWGPLVGIPLGAPGQGWVTIVVLEASTGLGFGWWYLNRKTVKGWFGAESRSTPNTAGRAVVEEK